MNILLKKILQNIYELTVKEKEEIILGPIETLFGRDIRIIILIIVHYFKNLF